LAQLRWLRQNCRQCWIPSQITTSKMHLKMGTVHTRGRGLLREWWWPVSPKLVFHQMAARPRNYGWFFVIHSDINRTVLTHKNLWNRIVR
jgi:hypothetical protein